jgi:hypothetical protein
MFLKQLVTDENNSHIQLPEVNFNNVEKKCLYLQWLSESFKCQMIKFKYYSYSELSYAEVQATIIIYFLIRWFSYSVIFLGLPVN